MSLFSIAAWLGATAGSWIDVVEKEKEKNEVVVAVLETRGCSSWGTRVVIGWGPAGLLQCQFGADW
jgi:hypothetical protein